MDRLPHFRCRQRPPDVERLRLWKAKLLVAPPATGIGVAITSYILKVIEFNAQVDRHGRLLADISRLERPIPAMNADAQANEHLDKFLGETVLELREGKEWELAGTEARIHELDAEIRGWFHIRDGILAAGAVSVLFVAVLICDRLVQRARMQEAPQEKDAPRAEDAANEALQKGTPQGAQAAPLKEEKKFRRPEYYSLILEALKHSIREEMGSLGSEEAAEAFLCVMPRKEVEELTNRPEMIAELIYKHRAELAEFLMEKKVDPRHLFARLGPEVTNLF